MATFFTSETMTLIIGIGTAIVTFIWGLIAAINGKPEES